MRWLVRFGYDGLAFAGWARQPGLRTVEGDLLRGLARHVRSDGGKARIEVASRTDRGVSARANALVLPTDLNGPTLLRQLNGIAPEIFCTAATPVPDGFRVRAADRRVYRYLVPGGDHDLRRWERVAQAVTGTIDVRSFGRAIPTAEPCWRDVESIRVSPDAGGLRVEVVARSFVWGMVRKIIGAFLEHEAGRLTVGRLEDAARGKVRLTLPLADPEGLTLWEVQYPLPWTVLWSGANRYQAEWARKQREQLWVRSRTVEELYPSPVRAGGRDPPPSPRG